MEAVAGYRVDHRRPPYLHRLRRLFSTKKHGRWIKLAPRYDAPKDLLSILVVGLGDEVPNAGLHFNREVIYPYNIKNRNHFSSFPVMCLVAVDSGGMGVEPGMGLLLVVAGMALEVTWCCRGWASHGDESSENDNVDDVDPTQYAMDEPCIGVVPTLYVMELSKNDNVDDVDPTPYVMDLSEALVLFQLRMGVEQGMGLLLVADKHGIGSNMMLQGMGFSWVMLGSM
ncbi:hypothetical protein F3Y22_tig00110384pilonHSYRG00631 [Hibiscus syriacus]|uniref:Uncharacterized protein n=1 Tax=Hibiscus syriacus TaxID=106335 RepID=A0A6A3ATZ4_HIBSY|nr:hypothetical protein F3Y22_tig00110384pilonHSYRG00631 [Hibiscus syriacus]